jgi:hypothetical protein
LNFDHFKTHIFPLDRHAEEMKYICDRGYPDECPAYMAIYDTLYTICKGQRDIVDNGIDLIVLSSALTALPRLLEVGLCFYKMAKGEDWLFPYLLAWDLTLLEKSHQHHIQVVSNAIRSARNWGAPIHTINLLQLELPYHNPWQVRDLSSLSEALRDLLDFAQVLRLSGSSFPLQLLSHRALDLHQFDMCNLVVEHTALTDFLETNQKSIRSIGFHHVATTGSSQPESRLSSSILCSMLNVTQSTAFRVADCDCLPFLAEGWRLLLSDDGLKCCTGTSAKRGV